MKDDELITENIKHTCKTNNVSQLCNRIQYEFVPSLDNRAAQCYPKKNKIQISLAHWNLATLAEKKNTIIHETAHIVAVYLYGSTTSPHGREWRECVEKAGEVPFISNIEFSEGGELYELTCGCNSVKVTKSRAMELNKKFLHCKKCDEPVCLSAGDVEIV